jgi:hypothetical protein
VFDPGFTFFFVIIFIPYFAWRILSDIYFYSKKDHLGRTSSRVYFQILKDKAFIENSRKNHRTFVKKNRHIAVSV